jgi:hypothetical protein
VQAPAAALSAHLWLSPSPDSGVHGISPLTAYRDSLVLVARMVYIFFGRDKVASGHFALPALPYFIGLFLGQEEHLNTPYKGRYFHAGGRFVCVGNPKPYETMISAFDLIDAYQTYFDKDDMPVISGITLGIDTFSSSDEGKAAAYIHSIEFLE